MPEEVSTLRKARAPSRLDDPPLPPEHLESTMAHGQRELPPREPSPGFTLPSYCELCEYWVRDEMDHHIRTRHHRNQARRRKRPNELNVETTICQTEDREVETQQTERTQMPTEESHQFPEWNVIERESSRGTKGGAGDEEAAVSLSDPRIDDPGGRVSPDAEDENEGTERGPRSPMRGSMILRERPGLLPSSSGSNEPDTGPSGLAVESSTDPDMPPLVDSASSSADPEMPQVVGNTSSDTSQEEEPAVGGQDHLFAHAFFSFMAMNAPQREELEEGYTLANLAGETIYRLASSIELRLGEILLRYIYARDVVVARPVHALYQQECARTDPMGMTVTVSGTVLVPLGETITIFLLDCPVEGYYLTNQAGEVVFFLPSTQSLSLHEILLRYVVVRRTTYIGSMWAKFRDDTAGFDPLDVFADEDGLAMVPLGETVTILLQDIEEID